MVGFRFAGVFVRAIFFIVQIAIVAIFALISYIFWPKETISVVIGGSLAIIATLVFALIVFARRHVSPKNMLRLTILGEMAKIAMVAGLFVLALHFIDIQLIAFLVGFGGAYVVYFFSPLLLRSL